MNRLKSRALWVALMLLVSACGAASDTASQEAGQATGSALASAADGTGSDTATTGSVATDATTAPTSSPSSSSTTGIPPTTAAPGTTTPILLAGAEPGDLVVAPGTSAVVGNGSLRTYRVRVEAVTGFDPVLVAEEISGILADERSWIGGGNVSFQRLDTDASVEVILASPNTVDRNCLPLRTNGIFSCRNGDELWLNSDRWTGAVDGWASSLTEYRQYLVNHEMGHFLGFGHVPCPGAGQLAPVMMQQTKGIDGCAPNSWPNPATE